MRRSIRNIALVLALAGIGSVVQLAQGADAKVEAEAKKADSAAMDDWLAADFKGAKTKLDGAIKKCGKDKCETGTQAALHRDLGVILFAMNDKKGGAKEFETAVGIDGSVTLGKDYLDNPDVKAAWEAAKKSSGGTVPTATTSAPTTTATVNPEAEGSLSIEAKTAPIGYVLPIVVTLPEGLDVQTVKVSYKTTAMDKYKVMEAKKDGDNFVAKIPCEDTQFQGDIKIYVRAYDGDKNEVEHYGTLKKPAIITLVEKMPEGEEAPTFPGGKEPDKCTDKGDCQPGFPCDKSANKKPQGSGCDTDDECDAGLSCVDNENGKKWCYETGAPGGGGKSTASGKKLWFGLDAQVDLLYISKADDICNDQAWACTKGGKDVGIPATQGGIPVDKANPDSGIVGQGGKTSGGPALGTFRVFASIDYFVTMNIAVGARVGYAFNGNPTDNAKFFPFHAEARLSYFLGQGPVKDPKGLKPYLMASGGMGEFDAAVPDIVALASQNPDFADDPTLCRGGGDPQLNCRVTGIKAYRLAGRGFAALGGGFWYMISPKLALNVGLKLLFPIPTFSLGIAPEVGIKF